MKSLQQIHQFSPTVHKGDGVSNGMFYTQKILQDLGFVSYIYTESFEDGLEDKVLDYKTFDITNQNQLLFIHYSIYYDFEPWLNTLDVKKVMIYHNITPYEFFEPNSVIYHMCKNGKEYLPALSQEVIGAIGVSKLNSDELISYKFQNVQTIPLLMDLNTIKNKPFNQKLFDEKSSEFSIIFVGRIVRNKAQHDLIEVARFYRDMCDDFKMYIIGSTTDESYKKELEGLIYEYDLEDNVVLCGKVSNEDLYAYYRSANLFLCMSEHEGFGIPLIESMLFDVAVMAYNSSNIKNTLNSGGILFDKKSHKYIAATIKLLRENTAFKSEVLNTQRKALDIYKHHVIVQKFVEYLKTFDINITYNPKANSEQKELLYQFEGPFDSSYSLAILNRYSALAFEQRYPEQVSLFSTEGYGDFTADSSFLNKNPLVAKLHANSKKAPQCKVVFRNLYPPRVTGMKGELNVLNSYGWEESAFSQEYVKNFNENLDGITVMSEYVKHVLRCNGVHIPISVVGLGVDHILEYKPMAIDIKTKKTFKFLHISSCFARKGVDILLKAYSETFTSNDDVTLIIKTFPNPHNNVKQQLQELQKKVKNMPEVILINEDLSSSHIVWLYQNSDCLVAPSRGEGFGLPMAEAMLFHLPVITTAYGGQVDFCTDETSWLCDYTFSKADTHMNLFNSYWAEPNKDDLKKLLKEQFVLTQQQKDIKTKKAYELISTKFTWQDYRAKTDEFVRVLENIEIFDTSFKKVAWVSSYNTKCGIATYSDFILSELDHTKHSVEVFANYAKEVVDDSKEKDIHRCWGDRFDKDNQPLIDAILEGGFTHTLINFNFGFFSMQNLAKVLDKLSEANIKVTIIFHSVKDVTIEGLESSLSWIKESLKKVDKLLVHNIEDLNILKSFGFSNFELLPHGVKVITQDIEKQTKKKPDILASYGFLLPHKGILELIEAFDILHKRLPHLKLMLVNALYPVPESQDYLHQCKKRVEELNLTQKVTFYSEYLTDDESYSLLNKADLLILPYRHTQESSSASVRYAVATLNPVLCTKEPIFHDVEDIVHFCDGNTPQDMAHSIEKLITNKELLFSKENIQQRWVTEHDWKLIARKIEGFLLDLP